MKVSLSASRISRSLLALLLVAGSIALVGSTRQPYSPHEKAFYADRALVEFVRPGLTFTINSAQVASDGTISVTYSIADPTGLPLDKAGVTTPGVSLRQLYCGLYSQRARNNTSPIPRGNRPARCPVP